MKDQCRNPIRIFALFILGAAFSATAGAQTLKESGAFFELALEIAGNETIVRNSRETKTFMS